MFLPYITSYLETVSIVDIVWDMHASNKQPETIYKGS